MVYTGKPSRGCQTCRERRIKCDEGKPACAHCIRSGRKCLGYRNEADLIFRNENRSTAIKATQRRAVGRSLAKPGPKSDSKSACSIYKPIPEDAGHHALSFFFSEFIMVPRVVACSRGYFECVEPLYTTAESRSSIDDITSAVSYALLSNKLNRPELMVSARRRHYLAVSRLKKAIADPLGARSDATLLSVLLLGFFETIAGDKESHALYQHHTNGAIALVRLRGEEILHEPLSVRLFNTVRLQMLISHIHRCQPIEPFPSPTGDWTADGATEDDICFNRLVVLSMKIPALRAIALQVLHEPMSSRIALGIRELMEAARHLDQQLAAWALEVPESWDCTTISVCETTMDNPRTAEFYPGPIYEYCDMWVANLWNKYRTGRIFCQSIILNCLERLVQPWKQPVTPEFEAANNILQEMTDGICSTVPVLLGYDALPESPRSTSSPTPYLDQSSKARSAKAIGGFALIWDLNIAHSVIWISNDQREWIRGRLETIRFRQGVQPATSRPGLGFDKGQNSSDREMTHTDFAPLLDKSADEIGLDLIGV